MFDPVSLLTTASPVRAERHREQPCRRGLPVGARDERDLATRAQVLEQPGVEPESGPAPGDRALAAPEPARRRR